MKSKLRIIITSKYLLDYAKTFFNKKHPGYLSNIFVLTRQIYNFRSGEKVKLNQNLEDIILYKKSDKYFKQISEFINQDYNYIFIGYSNDFSNYLLFELLNEFRIDKKIVIFSPEGMKFDKYKEYLLSIDDVKSKNTYFLKSFIGYRIRAYLAVKIMESYFSKEIMLSNRMKLKDLFLIYFLRNSQLSKEYKQTSYKIKENHTNIVFHLCKTPFDESKEQITKYLKNHKISKLTQKLEFKTFDDYCLLNNKKALFNSNNSKFIDETGIFKTRKFILETFINETRSVFKILLEYLKSINLDQNNIRKVNFDENFDYLKYDSIFFDKLLNFKINQDFSFHFSNNEIIQISEELDIISKNNNEITFKPINKPIGIYLENDNFNNLPETLKIYFESLYHYIKFVQYQQICKDSPIHVETIEIEAGEMELVGCSNYINENHVNDLNAIQKLLFANYTGLRIEDQHQKTISYLRKIDNISNYKLIPFNKISNANREHIINNSLKYINEFEFIENHTNIYSHNDKIHNYIYDYYIDKYPYFKSLNAYNYINDLITKFSKQEVEFRQLVEHCNQIFTFKN